MREGKVAAVCASHKILYQDLKRIQIEELLVHLAQNEQRFTVQKMLALEYNEAEKTYVVRLRW